MNQAAWLATGTPPSLHRQWNDDVHHVLHVAVTGESTAITRTTARRDLLARTRGGFRLSGRD